MNPVMYELMFMLLFNSVYPWFRFCIIFVSGHGDVHTPTVLPVPKSKKPTSL